MHTNACNLSEMHDPVLHQIVSYIDNEDVRSFALCNRSLLDKLKEIIVERCIFTYKTPDQKFTVYPVKHLRYDMSEKIRGLALSHNLFYTEEEIQQIRENLHRGIDHLPQSVTHLMIFSGCHRKKGLTYEQERAAEKYELNQSLDHLPKGLTHLTFNEYSCFNSALDHLPSTLTHLRLAYHFEQTLNHLPQGLTHFRQSCGYNKEMKFLPKSLIHLNLHPDALERLSPELFPNLTHLKFSGGGDGYNLKQHLLDRLPKQLTHLTLKFYYYEPIDRIPCNLTYLKLAHDFDQKLDFLPRSLTVLSFNAYSEFNQPVDDLPPYLQQITFGYNFNQRVDHLPGQLKILEFIDFAYGGGDKEIGFSRFNQPIDQLPSTLEKLIFIGTSLFDQPIDHLPTSLICLELGYNFNQTINCLPQNLQILKFSRASYFNQPIDYLPMGLTYLQLGEEFNQTIDYLPQNLQILKFSRVSRFNQPIDYLPMSLTYLQLGEEFNQTINCLPQNLQILKFSEVSRFNQPIDKFLPCLTHLCFGHQFNQPLIVPYTLTHLVFTERSEFNQYLCLHPLINLRHLKCGDSFDKLLLPLPPNLIHLELGPKLAPPENLQSFITRKKESIKCQPTPARIEYKLDAATLHPHSKRRKIAEG